MGFVIEIIGLIGAIVSILALVVTLKYKRPVYLHSFSRITRKSNDFSDRLQIHFDGKPIERLSKSTIHIWNAGRKTIRSHDLLKDRPCRVEKILGIFMERVDNMIQGIQEIKTGKMSIAPPPPFGGGVLLLYLKR